MLEHQEDTIKLLFHPTRICAACQLLLMEAPTNLPWIELTPETGIHYDCVEHLYEIVVALTSGDK